MRAAPGPPPGAPPAAAPPPEPGDPPAPSAPAAESAPATASELWGLALEATASSVRTQSMLGAARPVSWSRGVLRVEIGGPMRAVLEHRAEEIEKLLRPLARRKVRLEIREPAGEPEQKTEQGPDAQTVAEQHPLVREAMELFNARVERARWRNRR